MSETLNISDHNLNELKYLDLHLKWGYGGSSNNSEYHQHFVKTKIKRTVSDRNYTEIDINEKEIAIYYFFSSVKACRI